MKRRAGRWIRALLNRRAGCLILALLIALLAVSCGMLGRLTLVI